MTNMQLLNLFPDGHVAMETDTRAGEQKNNKTKQQQNKTTKPESQNEKDVEMRQNTNNGHAGT